MSENYKQRSILEIMNDVLGTIRDYYAKMIMQRTGSHFLCMVIFLYLFHKLIISCILKDIIIK